MSLISALDVLSSIDKKDTVIIDARGGPDARARYAAGHLQGAYFVDLETDLSHKKTDAADGGRHPLPDPNAFAQFLGKLGITPETHVIVYDDKGAGNAAARFWWMMRSMGHRHTAVINGGLQAMIKDGAILSSSIPGYKNTAPYPATAWQLPTVTMADVEKASTDPDFVVIDVRENYRYRGESEPIDLVAGHIPGTINIPYLTNMDAGGIFLSKDELQAKYKNAMGERKPENIIVHCGSGVTACHTLLALDEAGINNASLYVGSWSEWSRNNKPIARDEIKP